MAKESVDVPEVTMSRRVELRRSSAVKASFRNGEEKVAPHYLRASAGSRHDICKYGRNDAVEAKARSSIPKRAVRKQLRRSLDDRIGAITVAIAKPRASLDSKLPKMSVTKQRESVDSELWISDTFDTNAHELPRKSFDSRNQIGSKFLMSMNKTSLVKFNPSLLRNSDVSSIPKTSRQGISPIFKVESQLKSISKKEETPSKSASERGKTHSKSPFEKEDDPSKSASERVKTQLKSASGRVKTHLKSASKKMMRTSSKLYSLGGNEMELSDKHVISLNLNSGTMPTITSLNSSKDFGGRRSCEIKTKNKEGSCKVATPLRASLSSSKPSLKRIASINARKHNSVKIASHLKNQSKPRKGEAKEHTNKVEEKTLYVVTVENESQSPQSDQNASREIDSSLESDSSPFSQASSEEGHEESEHATSEYDEDSPSGIHENGKIASEAEENGKPHNDGSACYEEKYCQMSELKVITGKLDETQTEKRSSTPRRLKFRSGKVLSNDNAATNAEKVVLRHQNLQGKKGGNVLFNNVIEETATKLVETKKGKVKALVGAFETLISLQEQKPFVANIGM